MIDPKKYRQAWLEFCKRQVSASRSWVWKKNVPATLPDVSASEMLFQMMAQENIETLNNYKVKKIITACPHCLNTLKHDYPQMGGNYEVIHHAEFIDQLVKEGKIKLKQSLEGALTYHDPCYLGRYNNIFDQPRSILRSVSKDGLKELERHGRESFCCGAGGGRMWMEETIGKRINLERSEEIVGLTSLERSGGLSLLPDDDRRRDERSGEGRGDQDNGYR